MKNVKKGLRKIYFMVLAFCVSIYTKVYAATTREPQSWYGVPSEPPIDKSKDIISVIWRVARSLIIPIVFIIGAIIYIKRSSSSITRKVITIIIALIIVVLLCLGINYIISNI